MALSANPAITEVATNLADALISGGEPAADRVMADFVTNFNNDRDVLDEGRQIANELISLWENLVHLSQTLDTEGARFMVKGVQDTLGPGSPGADAAARLFQAKFGSASTDPQVALDEVVDRLDEGALPNALQMLADVFNRDPAGFERYDLFQRILDEDTLGALAPMVAKVLDSQRALLPAEGLEVLQHASAVAPRPGPSIPVSQNGLIVEERFDASARPTNVDGHFEEARKLLREGKILDAVQELKLVPPNDTHFNVAKGYLAIYNGNPQAQNLALELAKLLVDGITTATDGGRREDYELLLERASLASDAVNKYNAAHSDSPFDRPPAIEQIRTQGTMGLIGLDHRDIAEREVFGGHPDEAQANFDEFERRIPLRALVQANLAEEIKRLQHALTVAQGAAAKGTGLVPRSQQDIDDLEQALGILENRAARAQSYTRKTLWNNGKPGQTAQITDDEQEVLNRYCDHLRIEAKLREFRGADEETKAGGPGSVDLSACARLRGKASELLGVLSAVQVVEGDSAYRRLILHRDGARNEAVKGLVTAAARLIDAASKAPDGATFDEVEILLRAASSAHEGVPDELATAPRLSQSKEIARTAARLASTRAAIRNRVLTRVVARVGSVVAVIAIATAGVFYATPFVGPLMPTPPTPAPTPVPTRGPVVMPAETADHRVSSGECSFKLFNVCDNATSLGDAAFNTRWKGMTWLLGDPIGPYDQNLSIQYFASGRLEFHGRDLGEKLLLGLLGSELLANDANTAIREKYTERQPPSQTGRGEYDSESQLYIAPEFVDYYKRNGQFSTFGYPITSAYDAGGKKVQWFQRVRMEVTTGSSGGQSNVVLGPVGCEHFKIVDRLVSPACAQP